MTTGPSHYAEAERLVRLAGEQEMDLSMHTLAAAQVHAMLALAAATALDPASHGLVAVTPWMDVAT